MVKGYVKALRVRRVCHEMLSIFGGKMPHNVDIVPGGVTSAVTADKIAIFLGKLQEVREFIEDAYLPAVLAVAKAYADYFQIGPGCRRFLTYGGFNADDESGDPLKRRRLLPQGVVDNRGNLGAVDAAKISEEVSHSRYTEACAGHPSQGDTIPAPDKEGAYSWLKAPRYDGAPAEVGPLARVMAAYASGGAMKADIDAAARLAGAGAAALPSVLGRHLARIVEARWVADAMVRWLGELTPGAPAAAEISIPKEGTGAGLVDGPRGALGHWITIADGKIARYQLVVPTTWNASPQDGAGVPGPIEQALVGTKVKDQENPFEIVRVIRSFDPCLACSVHVLSAGRDVKGVYRIV